MKTIRYGRYYWQNEKVRLCPGNPDDWEQSYYNRFDSHARFALQYEIELPPVMQQERAASEKYAGFENTVGRLMFNIETLDGVLVGFINLNRIDERSGTFSIGMQIDQDYRGQGYGHAAMRILLDYAFNERRLHKFNAGIVEGNTASETLLKKLGCVHEGVRREVIYHQGRYWDEILYGLTDTEFSKIQQKR